MGDGRWGGVRPHRPTQAANLPRPDTAAAAAGTAEKAPKARTPCFPRLHHNRACRTFMVRITPKPTTKNTTPTGEVTDT